MIKFKKMSFYIGALTEWVDIKDYGDIELGCSSSLECPKNMSNYHEVVSTMRNLSDKVHEVLSNKRMCITLGGDHSLGFGEYTAEQYILRALINNVLHIWKLRKLRLKSMF